ncbi:Ribosome biogenesis protein Nop16 [Nesidiocoris tenuis]|uniref:Nucleolar protein 16 n=1 Tax=Nesidiocoris tenuis TaxID=355587 RepID=A0ABN7BFV5_9HEMI|nr:Ribosome biogenesis protein Nop16 [Nesidiocoris tenuis]
MAKIRKLKRRKTYKYNVNRKRLKNRRKRMPKIQCDELKEQWEKHKTPKENLRQMGLTHDANAAIQIPNEKPELMSVDQNLSPPQKTHVALELEAEAKAPRVKKFRLPDNQVRWLTKLIDKYGDDYKSMACDRKLNQFQETAKKLRQKIATFRKIPEQWEAYLASKQPKTDDTEMTTAEAT